MSGRIPEILAGVSRNILVDDSRNPIYAFSEAGISSGIYDKRTRYYQIIIRSKVL